MPARDGELLDRGLPVDHRRDVLAVARLILRADDNVVSIKDARIDHGITADLEHEEIPVSGHGRRQAEDILDVLFGRDRCAGRDAPHEGDWRSLLLHVRDRDLDANNAARHGRGAGDAELIACALSQIEGAGQPRLAHQVPLRLEGVEVVLDGRR